MLYRRDLAESIEDSHTGAHRDPLWIVVRSGAQAGARLAVSLASALLGSDPAFADLVIVGAQVAGRHARIDRLSGSLTLTDLDSGTGTLVNGVPLAPLTPCLIVPGTLIALGGVLLECVASGAIPARIPTEVADAPLAVPQSAIDIAAPTIRELPVAQAAARNLGTYRVVRPLGVGSASQVLLAEDRRRGRLVALKLASDPRPHMAAAFAREGQLDLHQPHIVRIYEAGVVAELPYLAMEYVDGPGLRQLMIGEPLGLDLALAITGQTLEALGYLHQRGLIHCDIKPENILLSRREGVKLIDFGIAQDLRATDTPTLLAGTPQYMAYEQAVGLPIGPESDIYAVAVVLYEMLTARLPFAAVSIAQAASQRRHHVAIPPRSYNPAIPRRVAAVLLRALLRDHTERYPTSDDFALALGCPSDLVAQRIIADAMLALE
ncbi:MAG: protein kinase [Oscillochloris sp.]|nr:protein kinase [Oscillochloris sp.]